MSVLAASQPGYAASGMADATMYMLRYVTAEPNAMYAGRCITRRSGSSEPHPLGVVLGLVVGCNGWEGCHACVVGLDGGEVRQDGGRDTCIM